jgi:Methyltransferase domain
MTGRGEQPRARARQTRLYATCVPGLGRKLRRQLDAIDGVVSTGTGSDGRADIVFFEADRAGRAEALESRLTDAVFAETGRASRVAGAGAMAVAGLAWPAEAVQRALSVWAEEVRPLAGSMTFRVVARVRSEARFRRTDLRQAMTAVISRDRPRWKTADPAQIEIWISEFHDGQYAAGLRLQAANTDRDDERQPQASDRLPPSVAAAMVDLAGRPGAAGPARTLLDACCGAGTILAEALAAGWAADGYDMEEPAVEVARRAAPAARVELGDARELLLPDECVGACVSRLPSGRRSRAPGEWQDFAATVLTEMSRVTRSGGAVVLLAPEIPRPAIPGTLRLRRQLPIRLLATGQTIWVFHRA